MAPTNSWGWHIGSWLVLPRDFCHLQRTVGTEVLLPQDEMASGSCHPPVPLSATSSRSFQREPSNFKLFYYIVMIIFHFCFELLYTPQ